MEFILLGFRTSPDVQILLFSLFLLIYMVIVVGNVSMLVVIKINSRLHTPMYFFLRNLSYLDLCYSSVIAPQTLATFLPKDKNFLQWLSNPVLFLCSLCWDEGFLLAVMAYDRFLATCSPFLYAVRMSQQAYVCLVIASYVCGCINSMIQTGFTFSLCFCGENRLDHFFLWCPSPDYDLLCGHLGEWDCTLYSVCPHRHHYHNCHSGFLRMYPLHCSKDPLSSWQE